MHAEGITEALLFHVDLLASAIRQAVSTTRIPGARRLPLVRGAAGAPRLTRSRRLRSQVVIKDHKSFLKIHPNTFRGQAAVEWLRGHAARALFGSEATREKNQQLSRSVALLLGQKLLAVGVFRQVAPAPR